MRQRTRQMGRRRFLLSAGVLLLPFCVRAQPNAKRAKIGFLAPGAGASAALDMFRRGMRELGYVEGRDFVIEARYAQGKPDLLARFASDLVAGGVDIIVTVGSGVGAARKATQTIPVVIRSTDDPVHAGFVQSLAHPGGNITGVTSISTPLNSKRLELLKDAFPKTVRVGVISNPASPSSAINLKDMQLAAEALGLELIALPLASSAAVATAFRLGVEKKVDAIVTLRNPVIQDSREEIVRLAAAHRIPAIYDDDSFVRSGGLMSYGADLDALHRQLAQYADKILKGAQPGALPIEQPTKFMLIVSLKTAKALGITIPQSILGRADRVID
jgi:putative tryptophan/tyrosine transport system substrate-binding protein